MTLTTRNHKNASGDITSDLYQAIYHMCKGINKSNFSCFACKVHFDKKGYIFLIIRQSVTVSRNTSTNVMILLEKVCLMNYFDD